MRAGCDRFIFIFLACCLSFSAARQHSATRKQPSQFCLEISEIQNFEIWSHLAT
jgi:hypothetical protein